MICVPLRAAGVFIFLQRSSYLDLNAATRGRRGPEGTPAAVPLHPGWSIAPRPPHFRLYYAECLPLMPRCNKNSSTRFIAVFFDEKEHPRNLNYLPICLEESVQ